MVISPDLRVGIWRLWSLRRNMASSKEDALLGLEIHVEDDVLNRSESGHIHEHFLKVGNQVVGEGLWAFQETDPSLFNLRLNAEDGQVLLIPISSAIDYLISIYCLNTVRIFNYCF